MLTADRIVTLCAGRLMGLERRPGNIVHAPQLSRGARWRYGPETARAANSVLRVRPVASCRIRRCVVPPAVASTATDPTPCPRSACPTDSRSAPLLARLPGIACLAQCTGQMCVGLYRPSCAAPLHPSKAAHHMVVTVGTLVPITAIRHRLRRHAVVSTGQSSQPSHLDQMSPVACYYLTSTNFRRRACRSCLRQDAVHGGNADSKVNRDRIACLARLCHACGDAGADRADFGCARRDSGANKSGVRLTWPAWNVLPTKALTAWGAWSRRAA